MACVDPKVRADWLISGRGEMAGTQARMPSEPLDAVGQTRLTLGKIPIMGTAEGGPDGLVEWNGEEIDHIDRPGFLAGARGAYALYVTGTSMVPRYDPGELIYVHPGRPIVPGCYVVVQFFKKAGDSMPSAWVKQFVERGERQTTFRQFNPAKNLKLSTQSIHAVHRVVGSGEL
jgi:phage repressor protein C with HTH and peptisase S24 domain